MEIKVRTKEQQAIDNLKTIVNSKDKIIEIEPPIEDTAQILLDYIINLQEDIANYVKITLHDRKVIDNLQDKIDKAIEYLENLQQSDYELQRDYNKNIEFGNYEIDNLLDILKGEDNNE